MKKMTTKKQSNTYKCLYCLEENPKSEFNKEHVLQKSFGNFQGALTLTNEVCEKCNKYFANDIDRILGRDSYEAYLRLLYGIKQPEEAGDIPYERLTIAISKEGQDEWAGVKVAYQPPHIHPLPQLGFRQKSSGDYIYFTLSEIKKGLDLDGLNIDRKADVKIISNKKEEWDKLVSFLNKMGIPLESTRDFITTIPFQTKEGKIPVKMEFHMDDSLVRGIAKVGFNYMAKMCGATFALKDDFNPVRQFIRYGELPPSELRETIKPSSQPFLANESFKHRRPGHILLLEWDITRRHVLARVSLFNSITWTSMLAKNFSGIFREIKSCHFYNIQNHVVKPLPGFNRELVP